MAALNTGLLYFLYLTKLIIAIVNDKNVYNNYTPFYFILKLFIANLNTLVKENYIYLQKIKKLHPFGHKIL